VSNSCLSPPALTLSVSENGRGRIPESTPPLESPVLMLVPKDDQSQNERSTSAISTLYEKNELEPLDSSYTPQPHLGTASSREDEEKRQFSDRIARQVAIQQQRGRPTLVSLMADAYRWSQETFPTVTAVLAHLPFALVPFAFSMFVLVQALVTRGWVPVFAYGWDHWAMKREPSVVLVAWVSSP